MMTMTQQAGSINKEIKSIEKKQMGILKLKNLIIIMKNSPKGSIEELRG